MRRDLARHRRTRARTVSPLLGFAVRLIGALAWVATLLAAAASNAAGAYCVSRATSGMCTFSYTGKEEPFSIPARVSSLHVVAIGATSGYGGYYNGGNHARGAVVTGDFSVGGSGALRAGETIYVEVGGNGISGGHFGGGGRGGFNGGGNGGSGGNPVTGGGGGGGGGGASDVRTCSRTATDCETLASRLLVAAGAGGGGGGDSFYGAGPGAGGAAGQPGGYFKHDDDAAGGGAAGTLTAGGAGGGGAFRSRGGGAGGIGLGGAGGAAASGGSGGGGGGGGGVFGGGGGGSTNDPESDYSGGGGGGSSLVPAGGQATPDRTGKALVEIIYSTIPLSATPTSDPSVTGVSTQTVLAGEAGFVTYSIDNTTANALHAAVFTLTLPKGLASAAVTSTHGTCGRPKSRLVTCRLGTLDSGSLTTVNLTSAESLLGAPARFDSRGVLSTPDLPGSPALHASTFAKVERNTHLTLASTVAPAKIPPGREVTYELSLRASPSFSPAGAVRIEIHLPGGFEPDVVSRSCRVAGQAVVRCHASEISQTIAVALNGHFTTKAKPGVKTFGAVVKTDNSNTAQTRSTARVKLTRL